MAKRRNYQQRDEGLGDPLGDFSDNTPFNIIQFITSNDTPVDSPAMNMHQRVQQQQQQHHVPDPQHNVNYQQNPSRLPDSPPTTDHSTAGSSASPSSNSDAPYSPENYVNYPMIHNQGSNQGLILGVHEGMMIHDPMMQSHARAPTSHQAHQQLASPASACFMSPYPPNQPTPASLPQVSPPPNANDQFMMNGGYGNHDLFNMLGGSSEGSLNSQCSDLGNRKRPRMEAEPRYHLGSTMMGNTPMSTSPINYDENYSAHQRVIKFSKFEEDKWQPLYDQDNNELQQLQVHVVADKGFTYSVQDHNFVNQKKNHFQVSVNIEAPDSMPPRYVRINGVPCAIAEFKLEFCGVKAEATSSVIEINQSQTDRKPIPHAPVSLDILERRVTKVTVPRLHFQATTSSNQRKNNKPNPDQKYFLLVIRLKATTVDGNTVMIQSFHSERVIVRATNPGSFEPPESDASWQRNPHNVLYTHGPVVVGGDHQVKDFRMTVHGDIYATGAVKAPSDRRLKERITHMNPNEALENIQKLHVVNYFYKPEIAEKWGLTEEQRRRTGLIAQELRAVIPDAVNDIGEYMTIDENRVFYETLMATQELCRLTGDLDSKIDDKVEEISQRLARYARIKKLRGSMASNLSGGGDIGDTKSILSYSRSSLASYSPSYRKEKRERSHCRNNCNGNRPEPLCSSKITQTTIVTLVFIMAACLLAMSGLYVMDWHNRNFGPRHTTSGTTNGNTENVGNMISNPKPAFPNLPMIQPDAPALGGICTANSCHTYCCADRALYETGNPDGQMDAIVTLNDLNKNLVARSAPGVENGRGRPLSNGLTIRIPSLNTTIDNRYCIERSCSQKRGQFKLYIPVSPYLPTTSMEVIFSIPKGKVINNCGYLADFDHKNCALDNPYGATPGQVPTATQIDDNIFELSVGMYLQSAYRFRVGYTTESCYHSDLNGGYEEYNLVFYRTCAPPTSPTDAPEPPTV